MFVGCRLFAVLFSLCLTLLVVCCLMFDVRFFCLRFVGWSFTDCCLLLFVVCVVRCLSCVVCCCVIFVVCCLLLFVVRGSLFVVR